MAKSYSTPEEKAAWTAKISAATKGKSKSAEHNEKNRQAHLGKPRPQGFGSRVHAWNLGRKQTDVAKENNRRGHLGVTHSNPEDIGDRITSGLLANNGTGDYLDPRQTKQVEQFKLLVLKRDNFTCQVCGVNQEEYKTKQIKLGRKRILSLDVHHILSFDMFPELRTEVSNGSTRCRSCHMKEERRLQKEKRKSEKRKEK